MIELTRVTRMFGNLCAVNDLTLSVPKGELFCFLGPNGAGKTTTIKMLTGLLRPTSGGIRIAGHDIVADPVAAKRHVGYIPDMPFVYERLTTTEFFLFTADLYGVPRPDARRRLDELFDVFGLDASRTALMGELSHGMRQRVLYCVSLMHEPGVLFIDEPLIGLDPASIRMIKDLLRRKARGGMTIFLTTHILALAEDIADRIGIISRGRLVALGGLADLAGGDAEARGLEDIFLSITERDGRPEG